jgi:hypothetical protein
MSTHIPRSAISRLTAFTIKSLLAGMLMLKSLVTEALQ